MELFEETLREVSKHIVDLIDQMLKDGEMGVLHIDSGVKISFPQNLRVVRAFLPIPQDYLKRFK